MKRTLKRGLAAIFAAFAASMPVFAESGEASGGISVKAIAAAVIMAVAASLGAIAMAIVTSKAEDGTARQPEAAGNIRTLMMMGLVFIETAIIYALITAIIIIFVL